MNPKVKVTDILYNTAVSLCSNIAFACLYENVLKGSWMAGVPVAVGAAAGFFGLTAKNSWAKKKPEERDQELIQYLVARAKGADEEAREYCWNALTDLTQEQKKAFDQRFDFLQRIIEFNNGTLGAIQDDQRKQGETLEAIRGQVSELLEQRPEVLGDVIGFIGQNHEQLKVLIEDQTGILKGHVSEEANRTITAVIEKMKELFQNIWPPEPNEPERVIHNIPVLSLGEFFKGREGDIGSLIKRLDEGVGTMAITQAIRGLGGVGKTRLAVEYGWRGLERGVYTAVLFVNCAQELAKEKEAGESSRAEQQTAARSAAERLAVEMGKLGAANLLEVAGYPLADPGAGMRAVLKKLHERTGGWLVVFDNVDEPEMAQAVRAVLPQLKNGKTIITTRLNNPGKGVNCLELDKLSEEASIDYLLTTTRGNRKDSENDADKVKELAGLLDGLPVALEQAAAFICYRKISFEDYLEKYKAMAQTLLSFNEALSGLGESFKPVLTVWSLTEEQLSPLARAIMTLAGLLAPDGIPEELFIHNPDEIFELAKELDSGFDLEGHNALSEAEKADRIEDGIAMLAGYSMIARDAGEKQFSMHRLVQETIRLRLDREHKELYTGLMLTMIHNDQPDTETIIKDQYRWYRAMDRHLSGLIAYTEQLWPKDEAISEGIAGRLATQINNLAALYHATNRLAEAEPLMKRALAIDEKAFGGDHPDVARDLNNLAQLYDATNRLAEAEPLMKRVVEIFEGAYGKEHPNVATALNNLAQLYQATNRLVEAEPLMIRALEIDEKALGKEHPNVAIRLNNLAQLYDATNRLAEAEPLMKRVVVIVEGSYGKEHPNVATALNNLAALYHATNRLAEAEPLMKRVVAIDEKAFGKEHPNVAIRLNNLAALYQATNRLAEAEPLMIRVLAIDEKAYGSDHPEVATDLNNLAQLYKATNRLAEAEPLMIRVVEILIAFTRKTGHPHPHLEGAITNYGGLLMAMGWSRERVVAELQGMAPERFGGG